MSAWVDRILREFPADLARFWIACDPDNLLLDERILHSLRERGFEVLPFEDSIAFRTEYEERYRTAWDRGEDGSAKALVLQLRGTDMNAIPWDYVREGRKVSLSLADLFPKLSYGVIRHIASEHHEALFEAHNRHATQLLGEGATKEFILTHIFRISPHLISRAEEFWRELLRLHYRGTSLPPLLADHVNSILAEFPDLKDLPVADLLSSRSLTVRVLQDSWDQFLAQNGVRSQRSTDNDRDDARAFSIPFDHPEVRVVVDNMFFEGTLQPVDIEGDPSNLPEWAKVGLKSDANSLRDLVAQGVIRVGQELPGPDSSHRDWSDFARRLGEIIFRFHSLSAQQAHDVHEKVHALQRDADARLTDWASKHFADLPSLPAAKGPVMVHHVPRYLAMRRSAGEERIALLVFDGLAMDQWFQIREHLAARAPNLIVDENACFAWLPTLTSVSRQALFSGLKPREFSDSIETTSKEPSLWTRFWQENGLRKPEIFYRKSLKRSGQLDDLADALSQPSIKVAGIVVDMIDEIVHGARLGKRGISSQIAEWCATGFLERLFFLLAEHGYSVYVTADHGNVEASGIGRLNQGVIPGLRGERVRAYRSAALAASIPDDIDAFRLDLAGLPPDFLPLYAGTRGAFVSQGDQVVAHGGISVEELIVPFVKVSVENEKQ
ncbi:BREX-3 system phosphatase PglZ [Paracoccus zhejiangensis]|uniref:BREX-3 system phosphatase PglZ n=1 Tax=Paracoccus zhejiangensis TaxID=1077935 RepID=A0A2H5EXN4_9RHOB|nr:BREX-3 system phosphatase PglZ [Paracoccus zhejiangensis]AUH64068.1 BREX-3 system phosphatase PglZ [Paracoccus zhejiangensis]